MTIPIVIRLNSNQANYLYELIYAELQYKQSTEAYNNDDTSEEEVAALQSLMAKLE